MSDSHGNHVWYELMTTDTAAAKAFYGRVVGWGTKDAEMPGMTYTMFTTSELPVAGLMTLPEMAKKAGTPPSWIGYVGVDDVDASAGMVKRLGGAVHVPPTDIPNVGRFSVVADPQGAAFALFKWSNPTQPEQPPQPGTPGRIGWHELTAGDWQKAFVFYAELFGWRKADAMDMGEMGIYQIFSTGAQPIGAMYTKPPTVPHPFWLYYFGVGDIDAAAERVKTGGGKVLNGPMEVPGGAWILQGQDPQGAMFALLGKRG